MARDRSKAQNVMKWSFAARARSRGLAVGLADAISRTPGAQDLGGILAYGVPPSVKATQQLWRLAGPLRGR
jgi:hypothetical protein